MTTAFEAAEIAYDKAVNSPEVASAKTLEELRWDDESGAIGKPDYRDVLDAGNRAVLAGYVDPAIMDSDIF